MAIPLYLITIEQDIFDTFRYLPHAVAVGVGFVTVAAAWKNRQMIKKQKRLEHAHAVPGTQLLLWFLVAVYFAMMLSITLFSREPGSRTGVDVKLFETWGNQWLPDRYFVEMIMDRISASRTYHPETYTDASPLEYFLKGKDRLWFIHPDTSAQIEYLLRMLAVKGEEKTLWYIKHVYLKNKGRFGGSGSTYVSPERRVHTEK